MSYTSISRPLTPRMGEVLRRLREGWTLVYDGIWYHLHPSAAEEGAASAVRRVDHACMDGLRRRGMVTMAERRMKPGSPQQVDAWVYGLTERGRMCPLPEDAERV